MAILVFIIRQKSACQNSMVKQLRNFWHFFLDLRGPLPITCLNSISFPKRPFVKNDQEWFLLWNRTRRCSIYFFQVSERWWFWKISCAATKLAIWCPCRPNNYGGTVSFLSWRCADSWRMVIFNMERNWKCWRIKYTITSCQVRVMRVTCFTGIYVTISAQMIKNIQQEPGHRRGHQ